MKRLFVLAAFVFIAAIAANAQNKANFAGSWSLDKAKSQGLSQRMQGADKVTWTITQDDKTISIDSKVEGGQPPAGGGAGGGGGTGGGRRLGPAMI
jgi:hypothetical protein